MDTQVRLTLVFAVVGAVCCVLLAEYLARSTTRPLSGLLQATRRIIRDPADTSTLEVDPAASSEVADLTLAFNLMVASIEEQRAGLNDTLGLLDSMLAHAPIGIAFFDTHARFIRMNEFLAVMNGVSIGNHIGRGVAEIFPGATGRLIEEGIQTVFATSEPVRDLEVNIGEPEGRRAGLDLAGEYLSGPQRDPWRPLGGSGHRRHHGHQAFRRRIAPHREARRGGPALVVDRP